MRFKYEIGSILTLLTFGLSMVLNAQELELTDGEIQLAIEGELWEAQAVDANALDVDVLDGIATLSGTVDSMLAEDRAIRIAQMTRGVISVVDEITIAESGRTDGAIRDDVIRALRADPAADSWEINAEVRNGHVRLLGAVDSYAESRLSEQIAASVRGVRGVENLLQISQPTTRPDSEIRADIEQLFEWDLRLDDALLNATVVDGNVTLTGSVGSDYEKRLAAHIAHVEGVDSVDSSGIEVEWWLRDEMQRKIVWDERTDETIRDAVVRAMAQDVRVNSFNVSVAANDGTITLTGLVDNLKARRAAAQDALNTIGVVRVKNYIKVRPTVARADTAISDDIREALARDPVVDGTDVSVVVTDGEANLYGTVGSEFVRQHAEDIAARVNGVIEVRNNLLVAYETPRVSYEYYDWNPTLYDYDFDYSTVRHKPDREILADIESELFWSPFVDGDDIEVYVENGVATLAGSVANLHERRLAYNNALEGGAIRVINRLDIEHD